MSFEWDEDKRQGNVEKHGIDFLDVDELFDGRPVVTYPSPRGDEERWVTIGELGGRLIVTVWTWRETNRRIISAHRADGSNERKYREIHSGRDQGDEAPG